MIILEGGNVFINTSRINRIDVDPTVSNFKSQILDKIFPNLQDKDVSLLGSTGKKESSGDIDIGINTSLPFEDIAQKIYNQCERLGLNRHTNDGNKIISI
jgi:hypothetical protein